LDSGLDSDLKALDLDLDLDSDLDFLISAGLGLEGSGLGLGLGLGYWWTCYKSEHIYCNITINGWNGTML